MSESPYDKEISELQEQIKDLKSKLDPLLHKQAEFLCPFKVGDIVTATRSRRTIKARITSISSSRSYNSYTMHGNQIRKDGTEGRYMELYSFYNWEKVNE